MSKLRENARRLGADSYELRCCVIGGSDGLARLVDQEHSKWEGPRPMRASQLLQQKGCGRVEIEQDEGQGVRRDVLQPGEEVG